MIGVFSNKRFDWPLLLIYMLLVTAGWITLFSTTYNPDAESWLSLEHNKQLFFIIISLVVGFMILSLPNSSIFYTLSSLLYLGVLFLVVITAFVGDETNGARAWLDFGFFKLQSSEFLKYATALVFAANLSKATPIEFNSEKLRTFAVSILILLTAILSVILQKDMGTALVFTAFAVPLYREGLPGEIIGFVLLAVAVAFLSLLISSFAILFFMVLFVVLLWVFVTEREFFKRAVWFYFAFILAFYFFKVVFGISISTDYVLISAYVLATLSAVVFGWLRYRASLRSMLLLGMGIVLLGLIKVTPVVYGHLPDHQRERIDVVLGRDIDPRGNAYNVIQSTRAIGSGGFFGKGFMHGPQENKLVPFRQTDFIFCTVGEEWGFVGSLFVLSLFALLLWRIINIAERQKSAFTRIYAYSIAGIIFFHVFANIGSVIKLIPVIGIPLPFFSYGGSAILDFTIMIFTLLRLDMDRNLQYEKIF